MCCELPKVNRCVLITVGLGTRKDGFNISAYFSGSASRALKTELFALSARIASVSV
jgi:hypothetical protein